MTWRYILALSIIAILALTANLMLNYTIASQSAYASIINISGRQRMLSQRVAMLSMHLVTEQQYSSRAELTRKLSDTLALMAKSHHALTQGSEQLDIPAKLVKSAHDLYFSPPLALDNLVQNFLASARLIVNNGQMPLSKDDPNLHIVLSLARDQLLDALNDATSHFEQQSRKQVQNIQQLENTVLIITWICLALEIIFIFRPMVYSIKRYNNERENALREATEANAAKTDFLANVSHEIRTPMNGIVGLAQQLENEALNPQAQEIAKLMYNASRALLHLLSDIIDYSQLEKGGFRLTIQSFDTTLLAEELESVWSVSAREKGLKLQVTLVTENTGPVTGDIIRIKQVAYCLIDNAIKFTDTGTVDVSVSVSVEGNSKILEMSVQDTGIGISKEKQRNLTELAQADASITREFGGLGLGLTLSNSLVKVMHGTLTVSSKENDGAKFTVRIPVGEASNSPPSPQSVSNVTVTRSLPEKIKSVLVAEDNLVNQKVIIKLLEKLGADVMLANNGKEAVELIQQHHFDLVLMDLQMPVMDGLSATQTIRSLDDKCNRIPVIAITANTTEHKALCIAAGMNGFIQKPVDIEKLCTEIYISVSSLSTDE